MTQELVTEERVFRELKRSIAESLRIDLESIQPDSSLVGNLGAESLDFLDINYRLEQAFGIRMARHFVLEHVEEIFGEGSAIDQNGRLTQRGAELLKLRLGDHRLWHGDPLRSEYASDLPESMPRRIGYRLYSIL